MAVLSLPDIEVFSIMENFVSIKGTSNTNIVLDKMMNNGVKLAVEGKL